MVRARRTNADIEALQDLIHDVAFEEQPLTVPGRRVQIPDWSQFLAIYDEAIAARRARTPA